MEINKAGAGQGMVALGLSPWVDYILPDRAPSAGVGHRTKALHPDTLAYFRTRKPASLETWLGPCLRRDDLKEALTQSTPA